MVTLIKSDRFRVIDGVKARRAMRVSQCYRCLDVVITDADIYPRGDMCDSCIYDKWGD